MAEPQVFINTKTQTFESLRAGLHLSGIANRKFIALNSHIANTVVLSGELVILGDLSTPSSTSQEAYIMARANEVHIALLSNNVDADNFLLDNFDLLQEVLAHGSIGAGMVSDTWSKHLEAIRKSLLDIERLHKEYLRTGSPIARDKFYAERALLFGKLGSQRTTWRLTGPDCNNKVPSGECWAFPLKASCSKGKSMATRERSVAWPRPRNL